MPLPNTGERSPTGDRDGEGIKGSWGTPSDNKSLLS